VSADEITLVLPRAREFHRIAHLVLGGLAVRLDLTFENLEDLQLALGGLLAEPDLQDEVTVRLRVAGDTLHTTVGPFEAASLRRRLDDVGGSDVTLRRLLDTVVDRVEIAEAAEGNWVEVTKTVQRVQLQ
jgi:hypothetical protein